MIYKKLFDAHATPSTKGSHPRPMVAHGDRRDGRLYIYDDETELAVNLALATNRPLLVRGPSGSGKSSLAQSVAYIQGWRYYETVISSRTEADDLLWRFDAVRRLSDAIDPKKDVAARSRYIEPGVLWWAFDRESARLQTGERDPTPWPETAQASRAVVLIDEIDKADPDVPNNLLVPLGSMRFKIPDLEIEVTALEAPLVIITTNDERELPNAFLRRCVVTSLRRPDGKRMIQIAEAHFGPDHGDLYSKVAVVLEQVAAAKEKRGQAPPSTAEYLDAIAACNELGIEPHDEHAEWKAVKESMFTKPRPNE